MEISANEGTGMKNAIREAKVVELSIFFRV